MTRRFISIVTALTTTLGTAALIVGAPPSEAAPARGLATSAGTAAAAAPLLYTQVRTRKRHIAANSTDDPFINCPRNYKAVGGGAFIIGNNLDRFLSLSEPSADVRAWVVVIVNNSSASSAYYVYADCVANIPGYIEAFGQQLENPSGTQTVTTADCPSGTVPYGGGGLATSASNEVSLNSSIPTATGWRTDVNNNSGGDDFAQSFAICGSQPPGYQLVTGRAKPVAPGVRAVARATCPSGTSVLSGGGYSNSASVVVELNSTLPTSSTGWTVYENNNSGSNSTITASALCATI